MKQMILGIFSDTSSAEDAITDLKSAGYDAKDISVVMKQRDNDSNMHDTGANVVDSAAQGAATGGVVGALAGLLIGVGAIAIPGIGGVLIGGPIAAALGLSGAAATTATGAITGGVVGGLVGALVGLGLPQEDAKYYEEKIKEGGILVAVSGESDDSKVDGILQNHGANQIRKVDMH